MENTSNGGSTLPSSSPGAPATTTTTATPITKSSTRAEANSSETPALKSSISASASASPVPVPGYTTITMQTPMGDAPSAIPPVTGKHGAQSGGGNDEDVIAGVGDMPVESSSNNFSSCFFADATLDLDDARVIEDTPDVKHHHKQHKQHLQHHNNPHETLSIDEEHFGRDNQDYSKISIQQSASTASGSVGGSVNMNMDVNMNVNVNANVNVNVNVGNGYNNGNDIHNNNNNDNDGASTVDGGDVQMAQFHHNDNYKNSNDGSTNNNETIQPQRIVHNLHMVNLAPTTQPKPPRRPRDTNYILAFIPSLLLLFIPFIFPCSNSNIAPLTDQSESSTTSSTSSTSTSLNHTIVPTIITTIIAILLSRIMYSSRGGNGEGDDRRYAISTLLFLSNLITCLATPILTLQIYYLNVVTTTSNGNRNNDDDTPDSTNALYYFWYHILVFGLVFSSIREVFIFATLFKSNSKNSNNRNYLDNSTSNAIGVNLHESINDGQRTMFRMLVNVALDILSRSLRPQIVFRFVSLCITVQLCIVHIVKKSFICAIHSSLLSSPSSSSSSPNLWYGFIIGCIGYWVVFTLIKILALVCSGGITTWFAQQSLLIERMERMSAGGGLGGGGRNDDVGMTMDEDEGEEESTQEDMLMPEAYRSVDANAYSSVLEFDDGIDDEYVDEYDFDQEMYGNSGRGHDRDRSESSMIQRNSNGRRIRGDSSNTSGGGGISTQGIGGGGGDNHGSAMGNGRDWQNINVKSFFFYGITTSFGSVLQCAVFGPLSNWIGKFMFYLDKIVSLISLACPSPSSQHNWNSSRNSSNGTHQVIGGRQLDQLELNDNGVESMSIYEENFSNLSLREKMYVLWKKFDLKTQNFVKTHNDLGLCHVAAYHKSYQKASSDVLTLMTSSGTSTIMYDDISSHMSTSICKAISTVVVIFIGIPLSRRKSGLDHATVCEIMVITYMMCYIILSTMIEPLRASIKAVYVSYAQHPKSLSQAFPLLYHRLSRISE